MTRNRVFGLVALITCGAGVSVSCIKAAEDEEADISVACGPGTRVEGNRCVADVDTGGGAGATSNSEAGAAGAAGSFSIQYCISPTMCIRVASCPAGTVLTNGVCVNEVPDDADCEVLDNPDGTVTVSCPGGNEATLDTALEIDAFSRGDLYATLMGEECVLPIGGLDLRFVRTYRGADDDLRPLEVKSLRVGSPFPQASSASPGVTYTTEVFSTCMAYLRLALQNRERIDDLELRLFLTPSAATPDYIIELEYAQLEGLVYRQQGVEMSLTSTGGTITLPEQNSISVTWTASSTTGEPNPAFDGGAWPFIATPSAPVNAAGGGTPTQADWMAFALPATDAAAEATDPPVTVGRWLDAQSLRHFEFMAQGMLFPATLAWTTDSEMGVTDVYATTEFTGARMQSWSLRTATGEDVGALDPGMTGYWEEFSFIYDTMM